ncbi:MAG: recombinase family protein [Alphaproteobacteria bacterium]|nr:recombinase family protein [Alphaproteobacteria bacterium]
MEKKYTQVIEIEECNQAVMLARVSSRKQERGASLDAQVERIEEYCKKNNFSIIEPTPKAFVFTESSTRGGRKKFKDWLPYMTKMDS